MTLEVPGIYGWCGGSAAVDADPQSVLDGVRRAQPWPSDRAAVCIGPDAACAAAGGAAHGDQRLQVAIVGRHFWRDDDLERQRCEQGPAWALHRAWCEYGDDALDRLGGEFVLAVQDLAQRRTVLATDRMARYPLYWTQQGEQLIFGGSVDAVAAVPGVDRQPSAQGLYHYVFFHMVPGPGSFFAGINKLGAAERLTFAGGQVEIGRHWVPRFAEREAPDPGAAQSELIAEIESAVRLHCDNGVTGAFLSGGLDSSTVAGVLARVDGQAPAFSIGFDAEGYDEIGYARIARDHFGLDGHEYYVTPDDILDALPRIAGAYDEPFGNSSALPAYFCACMARDKGMRRLLAGDGGDELFAGNERYVKQEVFEHYQRIPRWLRRSALEPVLSLLPDRLPLIGKAKSYVRQANVPLPERLHQYNFLVRLAAEDMFEPELLQDVDTELPFAQQRALYELPDGATRLNRMLYLDWQYTLADNDLRKVNRMCQLAGIEVAYPLLDDRVIDYSLRVPSTSKIDRGRLRHFYKEAMRGFLPDPILTKSKHGFGLPFGVWTRNHAGLKALVADTLGRLEGRGWFRKDFIGHARELHRTGHAAYYGELIWILMMLELWFEARDDA